MVLGAFAPEEAPVVAAAALMFAVAAWLLYLDFHHRVARAMALFLVVRGLANVLGNYALAPGEVPLDAMLWDRLGLYLSVASTLTGLHVVVSMMDPQGSARGGRWARAALGIGAVAMVLAIALGTPATLTGSTVRFPHPISFVTLLRYPLYALLAVLLLRPDDAAPAARARAMAGFAFVADASYLALTGLLGQPLGIEPILRGRLGFTVGALVANAVTLAITAAFALRLARIARSAHPLASYHGRVLAALALPLASALATLGIFVVAPGAALAVFAVLDGLWTAAFPLLFGYAAVHGHLFGLGQRVRRTLRHSTVVAAFVAVFLAVSEAGRAVAPDAWAPYFGLAGTAVVVAAVGRLQRLGEQVADLALGVDPGSTEPTRRLDAYRVAVQSELERGTEPQDASSRLRPLRAQLGITDRDHAIIEHLLRTGGSSTRTFPKPGELFLRRYRVVEELGRGGAGFTHLCRDEVVGRDVVVKSLSATGTGALVAVVREARAIGNLNHPNVVTLHDIEQVGDEAFIVMEHLPGGSLAQRLRKGPLAREEFLQVARDLLVALEAVHAAGIVHRDVKPSNILFAADGRAKLADFGVAHLPGFETTIAGHDQAAVGTIRFMSPEQALGRSPGPASDLYSAGVTLFEAITGKPYLQPRDDESAVELQMRAAMAHGYKEDPAVPTALRAWFARTLQRDPTQRFPDAAAMRAALDAALGDGDRGAGPSEAPGGAPAPG